MMDCLLSYCSEGDVYCYGAGVYGRIVYKYLLEHGIRIRGFIVTDKINVMPFVLGIPVYEFSEKIFTKKDRILITAGGVHAKDILQIVVAYGIASYFVIKKTDLENIEKYLLHEHNVPIENYINILYYHRVNILPIDTWNLCISPKKFEEQMKFLKANYPILRYNDDWSNVNEKSIIVTFDDGYADFFQYALPILDKYGVPATVFISTGNIDTGNEFWWDELENMVYNAPISSKNTEYYDFAIDNGIGGNKKDICKKLHGFLKCMPSDARQIALHELRKFYGLRSIRYRNTHRTMSMEEIVKLSKCPLITIGAHTVSHTSLATETGERQKWELSKSKLDLESITGQIISMFSYPFGGRADFSQTTRDIAVDLGYRRIATTLSGLQGYETDYLSLKRNFVGNWRNDILENRIEMDYISYG